MPLENLPELDINIVIALLLVAIVIPPTLGDILKRSPMDKRRITGITINGWIFFPLIFLTGYFAYLKEVVSDKDRKKEKTEFNQTIAENRKADSVQIVQARTNILDTLGLVGISTQAIKEKLDLLKNKKLPVENPILQESEAPFFAKEPTKKDFSLIFTIKNFGKDNAINLDTKCFEIRKVKGRFSILDQVFKGSKNLEFLGTGNVYTFISSYHISNLIGADSIFYFIKMKYQNESDKHMQPLRILYLIPVPTYNHQQITDINENDYNDLKLFLIKQKLW